VRLENLSVDAGRFCGRGRTTEFIWIMGTIFLTQSRKVAKAQGVLFKVAIHKETV
jgi:hypothetical protein